MNRAEAIKILENERDNHINGNGVIYETRTEAIDMAIKALENIGHLTDRPCDVCEFHTEQGCTQWKCVFCDELFGGMRR